MGLEYKSVVTLPSLTVVVVSRKDILVFDTSCVNSIDGWIQMVNFIIRVYGINYKIFHEQVLIKSSRNETLVLSI